MNSLLISYGILEVLTAIRGMRRGLYGVIYGIMTWVLILLLLPETVPTVARELEKNEQIKSHVEELVTPYVGVLSLGAVIESFAGDSGENALGDIDIEELKKNPEALQEYIQNFIGSQEQLEKYERIALGLAEGTTETEDFSDTTDLSKYLSESEQADVQSEMKDTLVKYAMACLAILISYLILKIATAIIGSIIRNVMKKSDQSSNKVLGLIWGVVEGILYICVAMSVISLVQVTMIGRMMVSMIYESPILKFIYENNVLEGMVKKLLSIVV